MCVLSIKVPIRKKSGNLFNDPRSLVSYPDDLFGGVSLNFLQKIQLECSLPS